MLAPFYFKKFDKEVLITNDTGRYYFLSPKDFADYINDRLDSKSEIYEDLKERYFLYESSRELFLEDIKPAIRDGKGYVFSSTSLHIFVVTNFCNGDCIYCQAGSNVENGFKMMSQETARRAVDLAMQSPQHHLTFEFQGGEPLSNFEIIKFIVEYSKSKKVDKVISYNIVTNLTLLTDEMLDFIKEHKIGISTSLDGHEEVHNYNRPLADMSKTHKKVTDAIRTLKAEGIPCGAIQTTTRKSLAKPSRIIDEYLRQGMNSVFIRPLTPLGMAKKRWQEIGYSTREFLDFYRESLEYIIEKNKEGIHISEGHASIFLSKILKGIGKNYMELRSPCGATLGQVAYYYDGNVYTCDEGRMLAEMGDETFKVANVYENTYDDMIDSKVCKATCKYSILEGLPQCSDCVYLPYCGTCPVINYAFEKDLITRSANENYRCEIYKGMLDIIFDLLREDEEKEIMSKWV